MQGIVLMLDSLVKASDAERRENCEAIGLSVRVHLDFVFGYAGVKQPLIYRL